jgi:DNA mismatch repair protein MutL
LKRINILDLNTSNKIAAGEVVERPYSVVKELIENSLDANAKNIIIEIFDGGQKTIKITDDGEGIHPEDIEKVFLPHATSKIAYVDDLFNLNTFGFRGEALASIAAVSNVIFRSRTYNFEYGREISISGGHKNYIKDVGSNIGTYVEVNDLFFNVPARLKFLKSPQREAALITDIVERLAMINPNISFKLYNNNNKVFFTFPTENLIDTIRIIYGKNVANNITYFEKHSDIASIYGYIGNAEISRGSRLNQSIYVNKRYVKNKLITTAVENAFKSFLTINKFPFFIVFIEIFPEFIDVNVHPTKSEIKFKDDRFIYKFVFDAVHESIRNNFKKTFNFHIIEDDTTNALNNNYIYEETSNSFSSVQIPIDFKQDNLLNNIYNESSNNDYIYGEKLPFDNDRIKIKEDTNKEDVNDINDKAKFPPLTVIGQFNNTYILAQYKDELYIIDQHAAHEKINFEKYIKDLKNKKVAAQILIPSEIIELTPQDFIIYLENKEIFKNAGFNIEIFGENTISIREVPIILGDIEVKNLFLQIIDNIKSSASIQTEDIKYDKIAKLSCKASIKANNKLSNIEMQALIDELRFIQDPFTCPHGRPTIIKITLNELEKRFKRIQ